MPGRGALNALQSAKVIPRLNAVIAGSGFDGAGVGVVAVVAAAPARDGSGAPLAATAAVAAPGGGAVAVGAVEGAAAPHPAAKIIAEAATGRRKRSGRMSPTIRNTSCCESYHRGEQPGGAFGAENHLRGTRALAPPNAAAAVTRLPAGCFASISLGTLGA